MICEIGDFIADPILKLEMSLFAVCFQLFQLFMRIGLLIFYAITIFIIKNLFYSNNFIQAKSFSILFHSA